MNSLPTRRASGASRPWFFLWSVALAVAALPSPGPARAEPVERAAPLMAYVGTFSSPLRDVLPTQVDLPPGNGRGIHVFRVDRDSGAMTAAGVVELTTSPSCLVVNAAGTCLYSANETDRVGGEKEGTVSAFSIDRANGQLTLLNTVRSGGAGPTYISLHPSGRFLFVANYFGGSVAVLPVLEGGKLGDATDVKKDDGQLGPARATSAPPGTFASSGHDRTHAHMIQPDPAGRFVLHADLGLDRIFVWKFDAAKGMLAPNDPASVALPPGDGPRHFHFHPNGRWLYSIQEEGSTVAVFDYDAASGRLKSKQTVSALPPGFAGSNFCSEILVSRDGRFVYAGNRLHDSIAAFSVGGDGTLTFVADEPTRGNYPRSFGFDPTGRFLYCCNQRGDNVTSFRADPKTGRLTFTGHYTAVGNPSCVVFVDLSTTGGAAAPAAAEEGFRPIFDGRSLDGWQTVDTSYWTVQDGAITATITRDHPLVENRYLVWKGADDAPGGRLADFELKLKSRVRGEGAINNGFQFRSKLLTNGWDVAGYQVDNNLNVGGVSPWLVRLYDEHGRHDLALRGQRATFTAGGKVTREPIKEASGEPWFRLEEWHEYHLTCMGSRITLRVDGRLAAEVVDDDPEQFDAAGILALQLHSGPPTVAQFKDIRLKVLKPAEAARP